MIEWEENFEMRTEIIGLFDPRNETNETRGNDSVCLFFAWSTMIAPL